MPHKIEYVCPVTCLCLPGRLENALIAGLHDVSLPTHLPKIGAVVRAYQRDELRDLRNIGVIGLEQLRSALKSAKLI